MSYLTVQNGPMEHFVRMLATPHQITNSLYQAAIDQQRFFISQLCILETAFTLRKLGQQPDDIEAMLDAFLAYEPVSSTLAEMKRGIALAKLIGFQNISDCVHLAIAESHCDEFCTYNKSDYKRLQQHTRLKVTLL
ncbi:type II toxin-antitoxin system VapC family toxin [Spirosoma jeollabukense]